MDLTPRQPKRPLLWADIVLDLQDLLADTSTPIYIVGGAVRDAYLHRPLKDIDIVTPSDAIALARKIANRLKGDFFPLDAERGVGRALIPIEGGRLTIDVASFRGADLLADLSDRDFTANAMAVDLHEDLSLLIDPLDGEQDLSHKVLRRCNPQAIAHDPIRALRAVRQSVQLGLRIEPETLVDIRTHAADLTSISPERVRDELFNLLALAKPDAGLRVIDAAGLLPYIIPGYSGLSELRSAEPEAWTTRVAAVQRITEVLTVIGPKRTDNTAASFGLGMVAIQLVHYRARLIEHINETWANERPHRALLVLSVLLHGLAGSEEIAEALRLSSPEQQRLKTLTKGSLPSDALTPLVIHRFWRKVGAAGVDLCLLALAQHLPSIEVEFKQDSWLLLIERVCVLLEAYYDRHEQLVAPPVLLNGEQLMQALNLKPGPIIGKLLDAIREAQVSGEVRSAEDALAFARIYLSS